VGTHLDQITGTSIASASQLVAAQEKLLGLQALEDARWSLQSGLGGASAPKVILGSLVDEPAAHDLTGRVFKQYFGL
jgi:hypothetical protein